MDTLGVFFNLQETVTWQPRFRRPMFVKHFFLHCAVGDSYFVGLALSKQMHVEPIYVFHYHILYSHKCLGSSDHHQGKTNITGTMHGNSSIHPHYIVQLLQA